MNARSRSGRRVGSAVSPPSPDDLLRNHLRKVDAELYDGLQFTRQLAKTLGLQGVRQEISEWVWAVKPLFELSELAHRDAQKLLAQPEDLLVEPVGLRGYVARLTESVVVARGAAHPLREIRRQLPDAEFEAAGAELAAYCKKGETAVKFLQKQLTAPISGRKGQVHEDQPPNENARPEHVRELSDAALTAELEARRQAALDRITAYVIQLKSIEHELENAVKEARAMDHSWKEIGRAAGLSTSAAFRRWDAEARERQRMNLRGPADAAPEDR